MNFNRALLLGNVVSDPEQRTLPSGRPVTNFRMATNRVWNDDQGKKQEAAEFHAIVTFGRLAEIVGQYLTKGQLVFVEGRIQTHSWDAQDGTKRYRTEIIAEGLQLGPRPGGPGERRQSNGNGSSHEPRPSAPSGFRAERNDESANTEIPTVSLDDEAAGAPTVSASTNQPSGIKAEDLPF